MPRHSCLLSPLLVAIITVLAMCFASATTKPAQDNSFKFKKAEIQVGNQKIHVEVADDERLRERGLMYRESLAPDSGMLFIFPSERILSFWMMNTYIPLSIGFFDKEQKLINVEEMIPIVLGQVTPPVSYLSKGPAKFALEMNKGWFARNKIGPGSKFIYISKPK